MEESYLCQAPGQVSMGRKGFAGNADAYPNTSVLSKRQGLTTQRSTFFFFKGFPYHYVCAGQETTCEIPTFHFYVSPKD